MTYIMDRNELIKSDCIATCSKLENILEDDEFEIAQAVTGDILDSYKVLIKKQRELVREMRMMMVKM